MKYDVIIVGGGHVGLYSAAKLSNQGYKVALFERKKSIGDKVICTGIIGHEAFSKFNLPQETVVDEIKDIRFVSPSGQSFDYKPSESLARIVDRGAFNRFYGGQALDQGAEIFTSQQVDKIQVNEDGVVVQCKSADQEPQEIRGSMILLATGTHCQLFHNVGLKPPSNFLGGAQLHMPVENLDMTSVYLGNDVAPGAFAWKVPVADSVARVGLLADKNPKDYLVRFLDRYEPDWKDLACECGSQIELRTIVQGPIKKSFHHRVLAVGEAAGQVKTTTGGGIYYGLLGADAAVETIDKAFKKGCFSETTFSTYEKMWKPVMEKELNIGLTFRNGLGSWSDAQIEALFEKVLQKKILSLAYQFAKFDWHSGVINSLFRLPNLRNMFAQIA